MTASLSRLSTWLLSLLSSRQPTSTSSSSGAKCIEKCCAACQALYIITENRVAGDDGLCVRCLVASLEVEDWLEEMA